MENQRENNQYTNEELQDVRLLFDDPGLSLQGWPGYRNRHGRSGLDPLDNQFEAAQMQGRIIRMLMDGRYYSKNPIFLVLLFIFGPGLIFSGLITVFSPFIALMGMIGYSFVELLLFVMVFLPFGLIGLGLILNIFRYFNSKSKRKIKY